MAESSVTFNRWTKEFEVGEFAIFWLIMESVLDEEEIRKGPLSLDFRLQEQITVHHWGEDWYHHAQLDDVIGEDVQRFHELLAKTAARVGQWASGVSFWELLKRPAQAREVGHQRYGDPVNRDALLGLIVRFALPWYSASDGDPLLRNIGWYRRRTGEWPGSQHSY